MIENEHCTVSKKSFLTIREIEASMSQWRNNCHESLAVILNCPSCTRPKAPPVQYKTNRSRFGTFLRQLTWSKIWHFRCSVCRWSSAGHIKNRNFSPSQDIWKQWLRTCFRLKTSYHKHLTSEQPPFTNKITNCYRQNCLGFLCTFQQQLNSQFCHAYHWLTKVGFNFSFR